MKEIFLRRSIRKYTDKVINTDIIEKIIKAGMNAPTGRGLKPWEFIIVRDKEILEQLSFTKQGSQMIKNSNVTIIVLGHKLSEYIEQDLAAVTQNMLLQATEFGIGCCWVGIMPNVKQEDYVRNKLNIPEDIHVFSMIPLGYPEEIKKPNDIYDKSKIHYEKF